MRDSGIPVARHHTIRQGDEVANPFGYPVFVKPARLGSSVGISKVHDESELGPAVALARRHDEKVLVEEFVSGMEVECGVLGNRVPPPVASLPGRIDTLEHEWYDYESKYASGGMELVIPPELPQETIELVQQRAVDAFVAGDCEGLARVDFFVRRRRRGDRQRAQHDARLHRDERLREALRGVGRRLRRAARSPDRRSRSSAPSAARSSSTEPLSLRASVDFVHVHGAVRAEVGDPDDVVLRPCARGA